MRSTTAWASQLWAGIRRHWVLWLILAIQAAVTSVWITQHGLFSDEALYLRSGMDEWRHWFHGTTVPQQYSTFFSGAYYLWPALGAIGYSAGGLAGARIITLLLTLGATTLVYMTGYWWRKPSLVLAGSSAALAGVTGLLAYTGASATFESLALFWLAAAAYLLIRADTKWPWLVAAGAAGALAGASKYGAIAWLPLLVLLAFFDGRNADWGRGFRSAGIVLGSMVVSAGLLLLAGGPSMLHAINNTTLTRPHPVAGITSSSSQVLSQTAILTGFALALGILGVIGAIAAKKDWWHWGAIITLTLSLLVVPLDQSRLGELASLDRNLSLGMPLGALAAGWGIWYITEFLTKWLSSTKRSSGKPQVAARWAVWAAPAIVMLGVALTFNWQGTSARNTTIASEIGHIYTPGTFIAALHGGPVNVLKLQLPNIPSHQWIYTGEHRFPTLMAKRQVSLVLVDYWPVKPGAERALLTLLNHADGWVRVHMYGHGPRAEFLYRNLHPHPIRRLVMESAAP